jgi:hypothetical protein
MTYATAQKDFDAGLFFVRVGWSILSGIPPEQLRDQSMT